MYQLSISFLLQKTRWTYLFMFMLEQFGLLHSSDFCIIYFFFFRNDDIILYTAVFDITLCDMLLYPRIA